MKLRILFVDTEQSWRGGQVQLLGLMKGLRQRGHLVSLASPSKEPLAQKTKSSGLAWFNFSQKVELSIVAFSRLSRIIRLVRPEIVHFNTPKPILVGKLASKFVNVRTICSRRVIFPLKSKLSLAKYAGLDRIIAISAAVREVLVSAGLAPDRIHVIHDGVDLEWLDSLEQSNLLAGIPRLRIGMVAHMTREKGHRTLVEAASRVLADRVSASFVMVGDGPLREGLEEMANSLGSNSSFYWMGFREDADSLLKQLDVFCIPSLSEGLSHSLLSAMAVGLPVVGSRVGGIPEAIDDGVSGLLFEPGDSLGLANCLRRLIESAELRHRLGTEGRKTIENRFSLEQMVDRHEDLYARLLGRAGIR